MLNETENNALPPAPPTSAGTDRHLSLMQIVSLVVAVLSGLATGLQLLPKDVAWAAPTMMILSSLVAALSGWVKAYNVPALLIVGMLALSMGGCSNLTPAQTYKIDNISYVAADIGLSAAVKSGKVPASEVGGIQDGLATARKNLDAGAAWITLHPTLANTPGVYPVEFTAIGTGLDVLDKYLAKYALLAPLPTPVLTPVATQPATQP